MSEKDKISKGQAEKEVIGWLDFKKVGPSKRKAQKDNIEHLIDALVEGVLIIRKDKTFVQTLKFPLLNEDEGKSVALGELTFKPRIKMEDIETKMIGVKSDNLTAMVRAYVCALTGANSGLLAKLDPEDNRIGSAIATFFL